VCEHDLVKVVMGGHVGVHGGLSHWDRPQELSSVFVIQDSYYHTLGYLIDPLDLLLASISVQELQLVSSVCRSCYLSTKWLLAGRACERLGTMARCTKWHLDGGLENPAHIVWGRSGNLGWTSLRMELK
jgi:hypothetical protein